jgi:1,4-dihydroxy-2-naphthoate octaprenyltransferase
MEMTILQYLLVFYLVAIGFFTPVLLIVLFAVPTFLEVIWSTYRAPKPEDKPEDYPADSWPLWFVGFAFVHNRKFGLFFLLGLIINAALMVWVL